MYAAVDIARVLFVRFGRGLRLELDEIRALFEMIGEGNCEEIDAFGQTIRERAHQLQRFCESLVFVSSAVRAGEIEEASAFDQLTGDDDEQPAAEAVEVSDTGLDTQRETEACKVLIGKMAGSQPFARDRLRLKYSASGWREADILLCAHCRRPAGSDGIPEADGTADQVRSRSREESTWSSRRLNVSIGAGAGFDRKQRSRCPAYNRWFIASTPVRQAQPRVVKVGAMREEARLG
ncbi:hypothetical protein [Methylobacterium oxalidis]|uniref:HTH merR-type domain-containing protein n=1 Tax=Methylobacterium oxalidis TaxID=944322 RepID=A0ABQ6DKB7_9HYPH|nr:hypothetical protein [Methylobacterium oxalidis]GLS63461.1 hypothetical protein GCM10007888_18420 [Methylobacterium oxalidis]